MSEEQEVQINKGYELYQIITDFGEPLEIIREALQNSIDENCTKIFCHVYEKQKISGNKLIIDIWDDGGGLSREKAACFFDLANSSKIDENKIPYKNKIGYKGHGAKIFFNSENVEVLSITKNETWVAKLASPIEQLEKSNTFKYTITDDIANSCFTDHIHSATGFFVRITGHLHFRTKHTQYKLNHKNVRDYIKWFTIFGSVSHSLDGEDEKPSLFLRGLDFDNFKKLYGNSGKIDPLPVFQVRNDVEYEEVSFGHYFPKERYTESSMKNYAKSISSNKPYYDYYAKLIFNEQVSCDNNLTFNLILNVEGYETKRIYNPLLTRRGASRTDISYTDSERYGLWACKSGIPVEKIDHWIEGAKGTFTFLHGFLDYDEFNLTANRGSIHNTDLEKLEIIKKKVNEIFSSKKIKDALNERVEFEKFESQLSSIEEDGVNLKKRFQYSSKRKNIVLPNGTIWREPRKTKSGYSESETLIILVQIMTIYPNLFNFNILDYDTTKGIDFVVEHQSNPKYIELKGTMNKKVNHPFRYIYKFICYDLDFGDKDVVMDLEDFSVALKVNNNDNFQSFDTKFKGKTYRSYQLIPDSASIQSMEVIRLNTFLKDVLGATID
ncbi:MAG: ATP-binding protein [Candidatus Anammoxibacter sp.]